MKILNLALPYLAHGAIKDKKNRYDVTEYNVDAVNVISLVDTNADVSSWSYEVLDHLNTNFFSIEQNGNQVTFHVTDELDRETTGKNIEVHVKSTTSNGKVSTDEIINVRVTDVNDNAPVFEKKTLLMTIPEDAEEGFEVGQLVATDADTGKFARIVYSLAEEIAEFKPRDPASRSQFERAFTVETDGRVFYKGGFADLLDAETSSRIELKVLAEDDFANAVHGRTKEVLEIRISDINDQAPIIDFDGQPRSVSEGADPGTVVLTLTATDADVDDENNNVAFEVDSPDFAFEGNNLVVKGKLDYETKKKYVLKVTAFNPNAADTDSFISSVTVIIDVEDANDPPAFINFRQDTIPKEGEQVTDLVIGKIIADDGDTGSQSLTYSIQDDAGIFTINSVSGEIIANGILDREYDVKNTDDLEHVGEIIGHSFRVVISDDGFPPAKTSEKVTVRIEDIPDESILWQPKTVSLCETTDVIGANRFFFAIAPDASDEIVSMEVTNVAGLSIFETQPGHFFASYEGKESSTTDMLAGLEFIDLSVTTAFGVEPVQVPFSICACNNDGELEGACHAGKAGPGVSTFPWWIVVLIVVIVTIVIVLALFVRRKPEGKLEGMQDPENMGDHDHLLSPDDMGSEQKASLPKILEEPTDNLGNIIRDAKQQADNEEQVPNTLLQFEYEGRNSMISNMSDLSDGDDTEQDIDLDKLPESVKRNFEGSKYNEL
jgi:hypothetical protein